MGPSHQDHRFVAELTWSTFRDHPILEYEVEEVLDDRVAALPQAQHEVSMTVVRVPLHQMAEDRFVADLHQRFRNARGESPETHPEATAEEGDVHRPP
jgi:hypothetical protein